MPKKTEITSELEEIAQPIQAEQTVVEEIVLHETIQEVVIPTEKTTISAWSSITRF